MPAGMVTKAPSADRHVLLLDDEPRARAPRAPWRPPPGWGPAALENERMRAYAAAQRRGAALAEALDAIRRSTDVPGPSTAPLGGVRLQRIYMPAGPIDWPVASWGG
jgi:hypothetical protein